MIDHLATVPWEAVFTTLWRPHLALREKCWGNGHSRGRLHLDGEPLERKKMLQNSQRYSCKNKVKKFHFLPACFQWRGEWCQACTDVWSLCRRKPYLSSHNCSLKILPFLIFIMVKYISRIFFAVQKSSSLMAITQEVMNQLIIFSSINSEISMLQSYSIGSGKEQS